MASDINRLSQEYGASTLTLTNRKTGFGAGGDFGRKEVGDDAHAITEVPPPDLRQSEG
jgi:hypothetical protein